MAEQDDANSSGNSIPPQKQLPPISEALRDKPKQLVHIAPHPPAPQHQHLLAQLAGYPATYDGPPLGLYKILKENYIMEKPVNETEVTCVRETVGRRTLRYRLDVIQEPKKARACGNGPRCKYAL